MRRLLQKQTQSLQTAKVLAKAIRSDIPQSGLDPTYNQVAPQIVIQQSGLEQPSPVAPTAAVRQTVPGQKDPIAEELKRIDADVKHGLLDKTGDGANANIIKLGEQLKKVAEGIKNISAGSGRLGAREIQYDDERLSAIRMQGERYIPGMRESLGLGERGAFSGLKNLFSLSPLKDFKMEDIDEQSIFGGAIKRKMAESQYAADQLAMTKTLKGDLRADVRKKKEYQDEEGQFSEKIFRQRKIEQFREQNRLRGEIGKTIEEIDRLKHDQGYTDEQIKKTGLYKTLQQQERELSAADPDRFARDVKEAKKKDIESQRVNIKTPPLAASVKSNDVMPDMSGMDVSEKESEQMLVESQQIGLLKRIEENTRPLKGLESILKSAMGATDVGSGSGSGDDDNNGLDPSDLGGGFGHRGQPRGRGIGSKLKQLGKGAISLGAKGARAALPYALPAAIAYGAARTIDYGASVLGVGDVEIDEAQDEVNWQKMSTGQKIGSGIARGIESVGSFLGLESFAKEAEVSRIEKETKMVGKQIQASGDSDQTIQTDIKFNESIEAADAGSEKRQQLRDLTDRAEMSWHGELERRKTEQVSLESIEPPQDIGGKVYQESDELKSVEKRSTQQSESVPNIINAPTTNVNQTTNNVTRPPARNTDSTYREYSKSRFAW